MTSNFSSIKMGNATDVVAGTKTSIRVTADTILFFDLDGTLIDTDFANYLAYKDAILATIQCDIETYYNAKERIDRVWVRRRFPTISEANYQEIVLRKKENYVTYLSETKLNALVVSVLSRFSKSNHTVLVTNCCEERAKMTLAYHQLANMICSFYFNNGKRNKFQNALVHFGFPAAQVIAFEDQISEIADAMEAGILYINPTIF